MTTSSLVRFLFTGAVATTAFASLGRAELLFERHQGGPAEYREAGINHSAIFQLAEATRIEIITGWFDGGTGLYGYNFETGSFDGEPDRIAVSISQWPFEGPVSVYSPDGPIDYFTTFHPGSMPPTPPGHLTEPGRWAGVGSLAWDLEPGTYSVNFFGAGMPMSYGYFGPISNVSQFDGFYNAFDRSEDAGSYPFGARIYGRPLAAIPEPATYAVAGMLMLFAVTLGRRVRGGTRGPDGAR